MESAITVIPFSSKITAPGAVVVVDGREVVHTVKDPLFGEFRIFRTAAGRRGFWEMDPTKVQRLIDAFKAGHNIKNACFYAGITVRQWEMFNGTYPDFRGVREACESHTTFGAMNTVQTGLQQNPHLAYRYVRERGDFNFKPVKVEEEKPPLQPTVMVPVQINNNIQNAEIENNARRVAAEFISKRTGAGEGGGAHRVENTVQV